MLEIITGRAGAGKTELCLRDIGACLERSAWGPQLFLLVPEHMTYKVEQELLARQEQSGRGVLRVNIFGFRRFARQILLEMGGLLEPQLTEIGRRLLLRRLLLEHQEELKVFGRAATRRGFAASLGDIIREFKCYGIEPEALAKVADGVKEERLSGKLQDLSLIYKGFKEQMEGLYRDGEDLLTRLVERIPQAESLRGAEFWLDGFTFFNPQERAVIAALLRSGANMHITLPMDAKDSEANGETGIFPRAVQTRRRLEELAAELKVEVKVKAAETGAALPRFRANDLAVIEKELFGLGKEKKTLQASEGGLLPLRVVEAATARLEVEAMAADILRLCREHGLHWGDIGILVRDAESYGTMLSLVLQDFEIPFFRDSKLAAAHHPVAELLRSALETVKNGAWRYDSVFRALKTGFFPLTAEESDFLENYVLEFGIRGAKRWLGEESWQWVKKSSFDDEAAIERKRGRAAQADALRRRVGTALASLASALQEAKREAAKSEAEAETKTEGTKAKNGKLYRVEALVRALYALLTDLGVPERLAEWSAEAEAKGRLAEAREHRQVWDEVVTLLEQLVEISGSDAMSLKEFADILGEGLDALEVSLIPPGLDYVTVASFDQNSLQNLKAVYVIGANAGTMPRRVAEDAILSDADRLHLLRDGGLEFPLVSRDTSFNEKYLLYKGFTQAREYLWVSYAKADEKGEAQEESSLVRRLKKELFALDDAFISIPLESLERKDGLQVARGRQAVSALASALRACREQKELTGLWQEVYNQASEAEGLRPPLECVKQGLFYQPGEGRLSKELAARLFAPHKSIFASVTGFEKYQSCPFRYFAEKGLRLKERELAGFQPYDLGNLMHALLEKFGTEQMAQGRRWAETTAEEREKFCHETLKGLAAGVLPEDGRSRAQLARIEKTACAVLDRLCTLDGASKFHPQFFELNFREAGQSRALRYPLSGGNQLALNGQIDRIDIDEDGKHFLVMDYKTGNAEISLRHVYYGLKLQLLTYIMAAKILVEEQLEKGLEPAGLLYFFVKDKVLGINGWPTDEAVADVKRKDGLLPGWILESNDDPEEIARAIDGVKQFLPYYKKDGNVNSQTGRKNCSKTEAELERLLEFTLLKLKETGERILAGEMTVRPFRDGKETPCTYCKMGAVCGFEPRLEGCSFRELEKLKDDEVWSLIDNELKGEQE